MYYLYKELRYFVVKNFEILMIISINISIGGQRIYTKVILTFKLSNY